MKAIIQKVKRATLYSEGEKFSEIQNGMLVLFGVSVSDDISKVRQFADKILKLRIFDDENGKTNKNLFDINGEIMVVSNFTLYASLKGTNRPDFINSAKPDKAEEIYNQFVAELSKQAKVKTGVSEHIWKLKQFLMVREHMNMKFKKTLQLQCFLFFKF